MPMYDDNGTADLRIVDGVKLWGLHDKNDRRWKKGKKIPFKKNEKKSIFKKIKQIFLKLFT